MSIHKVHDHRCYICDDEEIVADFIPNRETAQVLDAAHDLLAACEAALSELIEMHGMADDAYLDGGKELSQFIEGLPKKERSAIKTLRAAIAKARPDGEVECE